MNAPAYFITQELDTSGFNCPMPILKAKKALAAMSSGDILQVIATDKGSMRDFADFCKQTGHTLLKQYQEGEQLIHIIQRR